MAAFACTRCGLCCHHAGDVSDFPEPVDADGVCARYDRTARLCTIYEHRPLVCRVADLRPEGVTEVDWFAANEAACRRLAEIHGG